jgi:heme oxygenase
MTKLTERLQAETAAIHKETENHPALQAMVRGTIPASVYVGMLQRLLPAYTALEGGLQRHGDHPEVGPFNDRALFRTASLQTDIAAFQASAVIESPAAEAYAMRIATLSKDNPLLLIAHAYNRYMGDLSGGRMLYKCVAKGLQVDDTHLNFYIFPDVPHTGEFKKEFRNQIDNLSLTPDQQDSFVAEVIAAFAYNGDIFLELDQLLEKSNKE